MTVDVKINGEWFKAELETWTEGKDRAATREAPAEQKITLFEITELFDMNGAPVKMSRELYEQAFQAILNNPEHFEDHEMEMADPY